jgi:hypothetical protein
MKSLDWKSLAGVLGVIAVGMAALLLVERHILAKLPPETVAVGVAMFAVFAIATMAFRILTRRN